MSVERFPISDRASWLAWRRQDVTASAAAALLGAHPFLTAYGLWAEKAGKLPEDGEMTAAMERGLELEPLAAKWIARKQPTWRIEEPKIYYRDTEARLGATPDRFAIDPDRLGFGVLQIKSVEPSRFRKDWHNDDHELEPPLYAVVQAIIEAHLTGGTWAAVAALVVGFGIDVHIVEVPLHAGIIERVRAETAAFWRLVESGKTPEPDYGRDAALIAAIYAVDDGSEIDLTKDNRLPDLVAERIARQADKASADSDLKEINAEILAKLGSATSGRIQGGVISAKTIRRKSFVVAEGSYRRIHFKPSESAA
jgi:putative phage-type endonuclease